MVKPPSQIDNSFYLVKKLSGTPINNEFDLISLDVVSLFTNVTLNFTLESVGNRWDHIKRGTKIPANEFINAVKLNIRFNLFYIQWNDLQKKFGTPMGSSLSPIIADLVMQDLESNALEILDVEIPLYYRYLDDIALVVPRHKSKDVLETFNSHHPRMQFMIKTGDRRLNFSWT